MPRPRKGARLGSGPTHEKHLLAGLAASIIWEEKVVTTIAKAKAVRPVVEKFITKGKRGDLHARRQILKQIHDNEIVTKLFDEIGPRYEERQGGYTRIVRTGPRRGDNAEMAVIELV